MADVINRNTGEVKRSVDTPDYDPADWLVVDRSTTETLEALPQRYRVVDGDTAREATAAEKDTIDQPLLDDFKAQKIRDIQQQAAGLMSSAYTTEEQLAALMLMAQAQRIGRPTQRDGLAPLFDFSEELTARVATAKAEIAAATTKAEIDAVSLDTSGLSAPSVDVASLAQGGA